MSGCSQCESMPRDLPEAGVLYLAPQLSYTRGTLPPMQDLATLTAVVRSEWLVEMMQQDRLTIHFQPIVSTANPEKIFA